MNGVDWIKMDIKMVWKQIVAIGMHEFTC